MAHFFQKSALLDSSIHTHTHTHTGTYFLFPICFVFIGLIMVDIYLFTYLFTDSLVLYDVSFIKAENWGFLPLLNSPYLG